MSIIEYRVLRSNVCKGINWTEEGETILSLCEGLITEGSENNIQNVASLFKDLERQNIVGIDRLNVLKSVLKGMRKWPLVDEVEKFEEKRKAYTNLLEKIIVKLGECDLQRLLGICRPHYLAADVEGNINDVRTLFKELEVKNNLGADYVGVLKTILNETRNNDLLKEVEEFERKRKDEENADREREETEDKRQALATAIYTVPRVVGRMMGAVNVHCNFKTVGGVVVAVGAGVVLYKYSRGDTDIQQFTAAFNEAILPAATNLCAISNSSLCFTVQADSREALRALWDEYLDSSLQSRLQEFLVTEEIIQLADGEEVILTVYIDEEEFNNASLDLMVRNQVFSSEKSDRSKERNRRNSDSAMHFPQKESEVSAILLKLNRAEINFLHEKIESLEKEIVELKEKEPIPLSFGGFDEELAPNPFLLSSLDKWMERRIQYMAEGEGRRKYGTDFDDLEDSVEKESTRRARLPYFSERFVVRKRKVTARMGERLPWRRQSQPSMEGLYETGVKEEVRKTRLEKRWNSDPILCCQDTTPWDHLGDGKFTQIEEWQKKWIYVEQQSDETLNT